MSHKRLQSVRHTMNHLISKRKEKIQYAFAQLARSASSKIHIYNKLKSAHELALRKELHQQNLRGASLQQLEVGSACRTTHRPIMEGVAKWKRWYFRQQMDLRQAAQAALWYGWWGITTRCGRCAQQRHTRALAAISAWENEHTTAVFSCWHAGVKDVQKARRILGRWLHSCMFTAWEDWIIWCEDRHDAMTLQKSLLARAISAWENEHTTAVFSCWHAGIKDVQKARRILGRWLQSCLFTAYEDWQAWCEDRHDAMTRQMAIIQRWIEKQKQMVWLQWVRVYQQRVNSQAKYMLCQRKINKMFLGHSMLVWQLQRSGQVPLNLLK